MKARILLAMGMGALLISCPGFASTEETVKDQKKVVIAVKTDDVDLQEMDVSHLQPGDSETFVTENGKTIDLLRTEDDIEIYIDGELLDVGPMGERHSYHGLAEQGDDVHVVRKHVEVICDEEEDCDEMIWIGSDDEDVMYEFGTHVHDGEASHEKKEVYVIRKEVTTD